MRQSKWILGLYGIGILFLGLSAIKDLQNASYWALFTDLEFIGFALYMILIYPKRKLLLNQDLMTLVMIHFGAYALFSLGSGQWILGIIALSISLGILMYRLYRKKHKYRFILK